MHSLFIDMAKRRVAVLVVCCGASLYGVTAHAQVDSYFAETRLFAFNFCPKGWASASGQVLPIEQNQVLFSVLGVQYGGNGTTAFSLPDLRGRAPVGVGQGAGLTPMRAGMQGGVNTATLLEVNLPSHQHGMTASTTAATLSTPPAGGGQLAQAQNMGMYSSTPAVAPVAMRTAEAGSSFPVYIRNPYAGMNWCVALQGYYPSRP